MGEIGLNLGKGDLIDFIGEIIERAPDLMNITLDDVAEIFRDFEYNYAPRGQTGMLADLTTIESYGMYRYIYSTDDPIFTFILLGTAPHDIYPVNASALYWPGALHPVKHVHHPGTIANDYVAQAFMDGIYPAEDRLDQFMNDLMGE